MQLTRKRDDNWSRLLVCVGKQRDRVAFENLFNHFSPLIKGFCLSRPSLVISSETAEELVQEVMFKVWEKAPYFEAHEASASTWIFTVMRNCRTDMTRHGSSGEGSSRESITVDDIWDDTTENQPFVFLQPSRDQESINRSLQKLPVEQFHVIKKIYMETKSPMEISKDVGLSLNAITSRLQLALKKLQADARR